MVAIKFDRKDNHGGYVLTYPECPYSKSILFEDIPNCTHKKSHYTFCFVNCMEPITCPFNIHEELGGI